MKLFIILLAISFNSFAVQTGDLIKAQDFNSSSLNIGAIQHSFLAESSFKKLNGSCWTLVDGKAITGSDYGNFLVSEGLAASLPDMRGTVPRMKDNGRGLNPDGDLALGQYQPDELKSHQHTYNQVINSGSNLYARATDSYKYATTGWSGATGGNETRAKSTTINVFIKINKNCTFP